MADYVPHRPDWLALVAVCMARGMTMQQAVAVFDGTQYAQLMEPRTFVEAWQMLDFACRLGALDHNAQYIAQSIRQAYPDRCL